MERGQVMGVGLKGGTEWEISWPEGLAKAGLSVT